MCGNTAGKACQKKSDQMQTSFFAHALVIAKDLHK
jgi:hypothetical protein